MTSCAHQCSMHDSARQSALERTAKLIDASGVELVRFAWCDLHGMLRGKTLVASAAVKAMVNGVGMVSTLLLKDSADRTAYKVFDAEGAVDLPGFEFAANVLLLADPASYQQLPWRLKLVGCSAKRGTQMASQWLLTPAVYCNAHWPSYHRQATA